MHEQTVIQGIAAYFGTTPTRFSVVFFLACGVAVWAIVVTCIHLTAVPPNEGEPKAAGHPHRKVS